YREPDLVDGLVSYPETAHAARDHRLPFDRTSRRAYAHHVPATDALFARQRLGYLDEEMGLQLAVGRDVLRPVVKMLREPVGGPDVRELFGGTERVEIAVKDFSGRIMADLGVQQIGDRRFDGLVVFREGALDEVRGVELGHPLGDHDESAEGVRGRIG